MGKTVTIEQMEAQQESYRDYLKKIRQDLEDRSHEAETEMLNRADAFYERNQYDKVSFISGRNVDFMQKESWSLDNLSSIINLIAGELFGGEQRTKDSFTIAGAAVSNVNMVNKFIGNSFDLRGYIAGQCFDIISGVLESFGNSGSVSYSHSYKDVALGNGLHMFVTVVCDSYRNKDFFNNEEIYEYLYIYNVYYSTKEAAQQAKMEVTKLYEEQVATFVDKSERFLADLDQDKITIEQYQSQVKIYQQMIDAARQKLGALSLRQNLAYGAWVIEAKKRGENLGATFDWPWERKGKSKRKRDMVPEGPGDWRATRPGAGGGGRKRKDPDGPWSAEVKDGEG